MKHIHILLCVNDELEHEKIVFGDLIENLNFSFGLHDVQLLLQVSNEEDPYCLFEEQLAKCDLCLVVFNKTLSSSKTRLDRAYRSLICGNNPQKLYVYFKECFDYKQDMVTFRQNFTKNYGHFLCDFANDDMLRADFLLQFLNYHSIMMGDLKTIELRDGRVFIEGKEYVKLENLPFAGNNEEYKMLLKNIKNTRKIISVTNLEDADYIVYAKDLNDLLVRQKQIEDSLWETAMYVTKLSTQQCSERLEHAIALFSRGDNKGASALLDEDTIDNEVRHNLNAIHLGEKARKALGINIEEYIIKIKTLLNDFSTRQDNNIIALYQKAISAAEVYQEDETLAQLYMDYADYLLENNLYSQIGEAYEKAIYHFSILENTEEEQAYCYRSAGLFNKRINNYDTAEEYYLNAIELFEMINENGSHWIQIEIAGTLNNIALLHVDQKRFVEAENEYLEGLSILNSYSLSLYNDRKQAIYAKISCNLGTYYADLNRYEDALFFLRESEGILRSLLSKEYKNYAFDYVSILNNLGLAYDSLNDYNQADLFFKESLLTINRLLESNPYLYMPLLAKILNNYGRHKFELGLFDDTDNYYKESLKIFKDLEIDERESYLKDTAGLLFDLGVFHAKQNRYKDAEREYLECLEIRRHLAVKSPEKFLYGVASTLNNYGSLCREMRRYKEAEEMYKESLSIRRRYESSFPEFFLEDVSESLLNLGNLYGDLLRFEESECCYKESLEIRKRLAEKTPTIYLSEVAESLHNLGNMHSEMGRIVEAEKDLKESLEIRKKIYLQQPDKILPDYANSLNSMGAVNLKLRQFDVAEGYFRESLCFYRTLSQKEPTIYLPDVAKCIYNLGILSIEICKYEEAFIYMSDSSDIFRQLAKNNPDIYSFQYDYASCLNGLAWLYHQNNNPQKGLQYAIEAEQYSPDDENVVDTLAVLYEDLGMYVQAIECFSRCLSLKKSHNESEESLAETKKKIEDIISLMSKS